MFRFLNRLLSGKPHIPDVWVNQPLADIPLLAVDLELTSLDKAKAKITSVGWVEGKGNSIQLDSCFYAVIRVAGSLEQSPVIHGLTEDDIEDGCHVRDVLAQLATMASSHVWVLHNAELDLAVLQRVMDDTGTQCENIVAIDTLKLAVYQLKKHHDVLPPNSATLTVCRQRLGLPLAPAHNALDDAMATLQLWMAQNQSLNGDKSITLGDLLHTQAISHRKMQKK